MLRYNNILTVVDFNFDRSQRIIIVRDFPNDFAFVCDILKYTTFIYNYIVCSRLAGVNHIIYYYYYTLNAGST